MRIVSLSRPVPSLSRPVPSLQRNLQLTMYLMSTGIWVSIWHNIISRRIAEDADLFNKKLGLLGIWGGLIQQWLEEILPQDAHIISRYTFQPCHAISSNVQRLLPMLHPLGKLSGSEYMICPAFTLSLCFRRCLAEDLPRNSSQFIATNARQRIFTASADSLSPAHSSHCRLIGRGDPGFSFDIANVQFLCDLPQEKCNPRSPDD